MYEVVLSTIFCTFILKLDWVDYTFCTGLLIKLYEKIKYENLSCRLNTEYFLFHRKFVGSLYLQVIESQFNSCSWKYVLIETIQKRMQTDKVGSLIRKDTFNDDLKLHF